VIYDDPGYEVWKNKQGDRLVGTNTPSPGSNLVKDGKLFAYNNASVFRPLSDTDLKFSLGVAKFISNTASLTLVNDDYEFFDINARTGQFLGGEWVYGEVANATGNVSFSQGNNIIQGDGTSFSSYPEGTRIVVYGNTTSKELVTILNVVNNTFMYVSSPLPFSNTETKYKVPPAGVVYYRDNLLGKLFLSDSNANTTLKFVANTLIVGVDSGATANLVSLGTFSLDRAQMRADVSVPSGSRIETVFTSAAFNGSTYAYNALNKVNVQLNTSEVTDIAGFDAFVLSRSLEVDNSNLFSNTDLLITRKSARVNVTLGVNESAANLYKSPSIDKAKVDMMVVQNRISNTINITDANGVIIDSEVGNDGLALSRHITTKVSFANNRFSEDIRVYMTAYRPANTELRVYARIHNSADPEAFDDKAWTPLEYIENANKFSSNEDPNDVIEYELGLPSYSETANVLPGVFTTELANNVIVAQGVTPTTFVANNDVVKLYNPLIPEDYIVAVVETANSTTITLGSAIANNNVVGSGFKVDRLKYYNTAFNNYTNDNVARYYNSSLVEFDTFDSMQIKVALLSDSTYRVPEIDQLQVIGVSA
jgi:hypothetical protein